MQRNKQRVKASGLPARSASSAEAASSALLSAAFQHHLHLQLQQRVVPQRGRSQRRPAAALPAPSLAQQLGLLPAPSPPPAPPSEAEWQQVSGSAELDTARLAADTGALLLVCSAQLMLCSARRGDLQECCPICCSALALEAAVLLSCSHALHAACLSSLESFTAAVTAAAPLCPCCRRAGYHKRVIISREDAARQRSAITSVRPHSGSSAALTAADLAACLCPCPQHSARVPRLARALLSELSAPSGCSQCAAALSR